MKLIYKATGKEVKVGQSVVTSRGERAVVDFFRKPHKASSEGKVSIIEEGNPNSREYYVSVIGAEWVEREDRI